MDFNTTQAAPVAVRINGTAYTVPRFLLPDIKVWAAEQRKAIEDAALAEFKDDADARARFRTYFRPPPLDVGEFRPFATSPDGIEYVLRRQLGKCGVPAEVIDAMLANGNPADLDKLAAEVCSASAAPSMLAGADAGGADPLAKPVGTPSDAPTTGETPTQSTAPPTPATTEAA